MKPNENSAKPRSPSGAIGRGMGSRSVRQSQRAHRAEPQRRKHGEDCIKQLDTSYTGSIQVPFYDIRFCALAIETPPKHEGQPKCPEHEILYNPPPCVNATGERASNAHSPACIAADRWLPVFWIGAVKTAARGSLRALVPTRRLSAGTFDHPGPGS